MFRFLILTLFLAWFIPWVFVLQLGFVIYRPYEPDGQERYWRIAGPLFSDWVSTNEIPGSCKRALVASEDMSFYEHHGIDPENIQKAMKKNEKRGKIRFGASTITQQVVKNLFLSRNKSYLRKSREVIGALLLNLTMTKKQQLTWYFNIVEFGPRIYGLKAAAKAYFGKTPQRLNASECAILIAGLPSPVKNFRAFRQRQ
ncbi:MAG: biosynthetic peptidoglycan transglycosylase [Myxococcota bacterium]